MKRLPDHYPFAAAPTATLLEWAHMVEPPFEQMRGAAPWLETNSDVRCYLDGMIAGRVHYWRHGLLFTSATQ